MAVPIAFAHACAPVATPCSNDTDCARAVCVDGSCLERAIGETTERIAVDVIDVGIRDVGIGGIGEDSDVDIDIDLDIDLDPDAFALLDARTRVTRSPQPPPPLPPALNQDDDVLPSSCLDYLDNHDDAVSGWYAIRARDGDTVVVACDMETDGGGWTIVADIEGDGCPAGWSTTLFGCDRPWFVPIASASFPLHVDYSEVRGSARGLSGGDNLGFDVGWSYPADALYVDGLALSVNDGDVQNHLWTFAAGGPDPWIGAACPSHGGVSPPDHVGGAYTCDKPSAASYALWGAGDEENEDDEGVDGSEGYDGYDSLDSEAAPRDVGEFALRDAPRGDVLEARIMSPLMGYQSTVYIASLTIAVR